MVSCLWPGDYVASDDMAYVDGVRDANSVVRYHDRYVVGSAKPYGASGERGNQAIQPMSEA